MRPLFLRVLTSAQDGPAISQEHCATCHGGQGEGVDEEYDEALIGKRTIASLTKDIDTTGPHDRARIAVESPDAHRARELRISGCAHR